MAIIDCQVHAYAANSPERPWKIVPNWPDHVTGDEMVAAMDKVGVDGAIFISPFRMYRYDVSYAVRCSGLIQTGSHWLSRSTPMILRSRTLSRSGRKRRVRSASASS